MTPTRRSLLTGVAALAAASTLPHRLNAAIGVTPPSDLMLFPVHGQSDAYGSVAHPLPATITSAYPNNTFALTMGNLWGKPAFEPGGNTYPAFGGTLYPNVWTSHLYGAASFAMFFADHLVRLWPNAPLPNVGMIQNGVPGASMAMQMPNSAIWNAGQDRINFAKQHGTVRGLLLDGMQSDAKVLTNAQSVASRVIDWTDEMRDLHGNKPLIWFRLGKKPPTGYDYWSTVDAQQDILESTLTNAVAIRRLGMETFDGVHSTTVTQRNKGEAAAVAWMALEGMVPKSPINP